MSIFNSIEKEAISHLCLSMIAADGRVDNKEIRYWNAIRTQLEIEEKDIPQFSGAGLLKAMVVVRDMNLDKKILVCKLLDQIMKIDGDIDEGELVLFNMVFESCGLKEIASRL